MSKNDQNDYISYLNYVEASLIRYFVFCTLPIGIIGNLISIVVYSRPNLNKKTNTGFLFTVLCLSNLCVTLYFAFVFKSSNLFGYSISFPCGVSIYLYRSIWCFVPWMQAVACFDRFVVVVFPLKRRLLTKKVLSLIILVIFALIFGLNAANLFSYTRFGVCYTSTEVSLTSGIIVVITRTYAPFFLMLTLNFIVFRRLRRSKAKVGLLPSQARSNAKSGGDFLSRKEYKFIVSTLFIDLVFFLYYTPNAVYLTIWIANINQLSKWPLLSQTILDLFFNITHLCVLLYSVSTIFMFTVFNSYFRQELIYLLRLQRFFMPNLGLTNQSSSTPIQRKN